MGLKCQNNRRKDGMNRERARKSLEEKLSFGIDLWFTKRNREIFNDQGDVLNAFTLDKKRVNLFLEREIKYWFRVGIETTYDQEELNDEGLDDEQRALNLASNFDFGERQDFITYSLFSVLGRLNFENYLVEGKQLDFKLSTTNDSLGSDFTSTTARLQARYFALLSHQQNIGFNAVIGHTDTPLIQNQFFIGGLSEVRGFEDGQFNGRSFWQANLEYRIPSIVGSNFVLQHVAFADIGNVNDSLSDVFSSDLQTFQSIGTGLRFISPKIFRLNIRVDFARTFGRDERSDFSFGLQQFF